MALKPSLLHTIPLKVNLLLLVLSSFFINLKAYAQEPLSWVLIILPADQTLKETQWLELLERSNHLRVTAALSGKDLTPLTDSKNQILELKAKSKLEIAVRIANNPPLPLIYDTNSLKTFLSSGIVLPANAVACPEDVFNQILRNKLEVWKFLDEVPAGFVPGGGSLSLPIVEFLQKQKFTWTIGGFPIEEWSPGIISRFGDERDKSIAVFSADPVSNLIHSDDRVSASTQPWIQSLFAEIQQASQNGWIPVVVFDEASAHLSLNRFLTECDQQMNVLVSGRMLLASELSQKEQPDSASMALQIWPYSWNWIQGLGSPRGPGLTAWIGDPKKNEAWELLWRTREIINRYRNSGTADLEKLDQVMDQFYEAESIDFFQWAGSTQTEADNALVFNSMQKSIEFKTLLKQIYSDLKVPAPAILDHAPTGTTVKTTAAGTSFLTPEKIAIHASESKIKTETAENLISWVQTDLEENHPKDYPQLKTFSVRVSDDLQEPSLISFQFSFKNLRSAVPLAVELYIDINHREGAGSTALLHDRNAAVIPLSGWEYALEIYVPSHHLPHSEGVSAARRQAAVPFLQNADCKLLRSGRTDAFYKTTAYIQKDSVIEVKIPKDLLGKDPLRWGYLVCIIKNNQMVDFLSPVEDKVQTLNELSQRESSMILPMVYGNE